jgi:hypothetical protein
VSSPTRRAARAGKSEAYCSQSAVIVVIISFVAATGGAAKSPESRG